MPETTKIDWNQWQQVQARLRKNINEEADEAIAYVKKVTEPVKIIPKRETPRGDRRRASHQPWARTPLDGYSLQHSDIARHVTGLKYAGYAMREAFEDAAQKFEIKPHSVENLYYKKKTLFDLAEHEMMERAIKEYHQNLWLMRSALSQVGPVAVETLANILQNPDASMNVKSKSAIAVLKMLDVDGSSNANQNERVALESLKIIRDVTQSRIKEEESHVIDAEDAEILEDNECED